MIVDGIEVSPAAESALENWMRTHVAPKGFRASSLVAQAEALKVSNGAGTTMRIADRMLQKHKRLRNIKLFGANNWCWVKEN